MKKSKFKTQKYVVFGMGKSGVSAVTLLSKLGAEVHAVSQGDPATWKDYSFLRSCIKEPFLHNQSEVDLERFKEVDFLVISPGISKKHPILDSLKAPIISEIELGVMALEEEAPVYIGVTGTNGKTTTVSFLSEMLDKIGKDTFVGGNIGIPLCDYIIQRMDKKRGKADYILLELSSFQLESSPSFHPRVAGILNVAANHGERYVGLDDYKNAKLKIFNNSKQGDTVILNQTLQGDYQTEANIVYLEENGEFSYPYSLDHFKLLGFHNIFNLKFCLEVLVALKELNPKIQEAIDSFSGVIHRLQYVKSNDAFRVYNDAKSTNWEATLTALSAFEGEKNLYLILGGKKRGRGDDVAPYIKALSCLVRKIYLIGETEDDLAVELTGEIAFEKCGSLKNVFTKIRGEEFSGVLLFSPAFPSFDQYKDYVERGEEFIYLAETLATD